LCRPAVRELGLVGEARSCLDDPWECLTHLQAIFAAMVGHADTEEWPEAVDVAWVRSLVPDAGDTNRSRWPTDPVWQLVQSAPFADAPTPARPLIRRRRPGTATSVPGRGQFGCLASRAALHHADGGPGPSHARWGRHCPRSKRWRPRRLRGAVTLVSWCESGAASAGSPANR